jgi:hypothetical protein
MNLPYGWTDQYALSFLIEENLKVREEIKAANDRISFLEAELTRLDMTKANKVGRKPKDS